MEYQYKKPISLLLETPQMNLKPTVRPRFARTAISLTLAVSACLVTFYVIESENGQSLRHNDDRCLFILWSLFYLSTPTFEEALNIFGINAE